MKSTIPESGPNNAAGQAQQEAPLGVVESSTSGRPKDRYESGSDSPAPAAPATPKPARPVMSEGNLSGWSVYVTSLERYTDQLERLLDQREKQLIKAQGDLIERNHELFVARSASGRIEIRNNEDGTLDEAVLEHGPANFHLEQLDTGAWWMALTLDKQRVDINLHAKGKITANVSDEGEVKLLSDTETVSTTQPTTKEK